MAEHCPVLGLRGSCEPHVLTPGHCWGRWADGHNGVKVKEPRVSCPGGRGRCPLVPRVSPSELSPLLRLRVQDISVRWLRWGGTRGRPRGMPSHQPSSPWEAQGVRALEPVSVGAICAAREDLKTEQCPGLSDGRRPMQTPGSG